jgi:hypothetical protein
MTHWQTGLFSLFFLLALPRGVSAQPHPTRWSPQNFAFTLSFDASDQERLYTINPTLRETGLQYTIRAISTSFVADGSGVYGLVVKCRSANFTGTAAQIAHTIPVFRHQPWNQAVSDRFGAAFGGSVSCLLDSPIDIGIVRSNAKDTAKVLVPLSISGIIERVPAVASR